MKIAIDAMGGDHAPKNIVLGAQYAIKTLNDPELELILVGDKSQIEKYLTDDKQISIVHASEVISSSDSLLRIHKRSETSLVKGLNLVKDDSANAFISATSTGAILSASNFIIGRIKNVARAALVIALPSLNQRPTVFLDLGATSDPKAEYMLTHAKLGQIYANKILDVKRPKIGLLNIGEEPSKGSALYREAHKLLSEDESLDFVGNIEGRQILENEVDVLVADGFAGNIALKTLEGTALGLINFMKQGIMSSVKTKLAGLVLKKPVFDKMKQEFDFNEYGGAVLLGLNKIVVKAHGVSKEQGLVSAIKQVQKAYDEKIIDKFIEQLDTE